MNELNTWGVTSTPNSDLMNSLAACGLSIPRLIASRIASDFFIFGAASAASGASMPFFLAMFHLGTAGVPSI
jgi:hypothetical protein